jgi:hypothetical protein
MARGFSRIGALVIFCLFGFMGYAVFASPGMQGSPPAFDGNLNGGTLTFASGTTCADSSGNIVCSVASGKGFQLNVNGTKVLDFASNGDMTIGSSQLYGFNSGLVKTNQIYGPTSTTQIKINSALAAGNTQADFLITTQNTRTAGNLLDIQNPDATSHIQVPPTGGIRFNAGAVAKPTCNSAMRGTIFYTPGGAGVADIFEVCTKSAADAYAWRDIALVTP